MAEPLNPIEELLTVPDVARVLRLTTGTVKRIPPAELPFSRAGARGDRRYRRADVESYIATRRVSS